MPEDERSSFYICTIFIPCSELQELQTVWYWMDCLWSSVVNIRSSCNCYPSFFYPSGWCLMIPVVIQKRNFIKELHVYPIDIQRVWSSWRRFPFFCVHFFVVTFFFATCILNVTRCLFVILLSFGFRWIGCDIVKYRVCWKCHNIPLIVKWLSVCDNSEIV